MEQLTQNQIKVLARKARHELASINEPMPYEDCDNTWTPPEYNWFGCESDAELIETLAGAIGVEQSELLGESTLYHSIEVAYYG